MLTSSLLKQHAATLGVQGCGIASNDRFAQAPDGFKPTDIYSNCKSTVVLFKLMPAGAIMAENPVPYTHAAYLLYNELDRLSLEMLRYCQTFGVSGVVIPADTPYLYWDDENKVGRGILSMKHAAVQAGLGMMGRSTILINREYGNMVYLGAFLIDAELEPDPLVTDFACPPGCHVCEKSCPQQAIGDMRVAQKLCREHSFVKVGRGWDLYSCHLCRSRCPLRFGEKQATH